MIDLEVILFLYLLTSRIFGKGERKIAILLNDKGIAIAFAIKITIFRSKRLAEKFDGIFTQIVLLLHEENLVSLKVQYIDGTKIESVANKYTFVWKGSTEKNKTKLENNVREVLKAAEDALAIENAEENQVLTSEEMARRADRILKKMDDEDISDKKMRKAVEKVRSESAPKQKEYENKLETLGERGTAIARQIQMPRSCV